MWIDGRLVALGTGVGAAGRDVAATLVSRAGPYPTTRSAADGAFRLELPVRAGDTLEIRVAESDRFRSVRRAIRIAALPGDGILSVGRITLAPWDLDADGRPVPIPRTVTFLRATVYDDTDAFSAGEFYFYFDVRDADRRHPDGTPIGDYRITGLHRISSGHTVTFAPPIRLKVPYDASRFEVVAQAKEDDTFGRDVNPFLDPTGVSETLRAVGNRFTAREHYGRGMEHHMAVPGSYAVDFRID